MSLWKALSIISKMFIKDFILLETILRFIRNITTQETILFRQKPSTQSWKWLVLLLFQLCNI